MQLVAIRINLQFQLFRSFNSCLTNCLTHSGFLRISRATGNFQGPSGFLVSVQMFPVELTATDWRSWPTPGAETRETRLTSVRNSGLGLINTAFMLSFGRAPSPAPLFLLFMTLQFFSFPQNVMNAVFYWCGDSPKP